MVEAWLRSEGYLLLLGGAIFKEHVHVHVQPRIYIQRFALVCGCNVQKLVDGIVAGRQY